MARTGLYSFTPLSNPLGTAFSGVYALPPITGDDTRTLHIDPTGNAVRYIEQSRGMWVTSGTGPMFLGAAEFKVVLDFLPPWVSNTGNMNDNFTAGSGGYGKGTAGLEAALLDFWQRVVEGGLGTLIDNLPPNTITRSGTSIVSRSTQCGINSDVEIVRYAGGTRAQATVNFFSPSGVWLLSDGATEVAIY